MKTHLLLRSEDKSRQPLLMDFDPAVKHTLLYVLYIESTYTAKPYKDFLRFIEAERDFYVCDDSSGGLKIYPNKTKLGLFVFLLASCIQFRLI